MPLMKISEGDILRAQDLLRALKDQGVPARVYTKRDFETLECALDLLKSKWTPKMRFIR